MCQLSVQEKTAPITQQLTTSTCFFLLLLEGWALLSSPGLSRPHVSSHSQIQTPLSDTAILTVKGRRKGLKTKHPTAFKLLLGETTIIPTHISLTKAHDRQQTTENNPTCPNTMLQWYLPPTTPVLHTTGAKARHDTFLQLPLVELWQLFIILVSVLVLLWETQTSFLRISFWLVFLGTLGKLVLFKFRWIVVTAYSSPMTGTKSQQHQDPSIHYSQATSLFNPICKLKHRFLN